MPDHRPHSTARGHVLLHAELAGQPPSELNNHVAIAIDESSCQIAVSGPGSVHPPVVSTSGDVRRYVTKVLAAMQRTSRAAVIRPVPKPTTPKRSPNPHDPVPCPLCLGSAWFDCECCDGAGVVTARQAAAWHEERGI